MTAPAPAQPICASSKCDRPVKDAVVCPHCVAKTRAELREIPDLLAELEVTLTRQDVHGRDPMVLPPEEARTKDGPPAATTALQYRPHASDAGRWLHATLDAWTRHLLASLDLTWADAFEPPPPRWPNDRPPGAPFGPLRPPGSAWTGPLRPGGTTLLVPVAGLAAQPWVERGDDTAELAAWLDRHPSAMQADPEAGTLVDAIRWAVESVRRVIYPRQTHYMGPCDCSQPGAPVDLYAPANARMIKCSNCGREHVVARRTEWLREQAEDRLLTAEDMSRALPRLVVDIAHRPLTASMIRGYGRRGRIMEYRPDPREWTTQLDPDTGQEVPVPPAPWYRVGEVVELLRTLLADEQAKTAARTRRDNASTAEKVAAAQRRFLAALTS